MRDSNLDAVLLRYAGLQADIRRQRRILSELQQEGHPTVGARTLLCLLEGDLAHLARSLDGWRESGRQQL